jgi:hypothetical protein
MHALLPRVRLLAAVLCLAGAPSAQIRETDLDALMAKALEHRADAWRTLGQYILTEREQLELRGLMGVPLFGERRVFTWSLRDGYFVRSPLEFNGVRIGDAKRREYEERWLRREKERDRKQAEKRAKDGGSTPPPPADIDAIIRQSSEPRFISAAYFLNFTFEPGNYYLAGRETFEGRPVVRVEYFPRRLFSDRDDDRKKAGEPARKDEDDFDRQMNKVARVTLWVDAERAMILRYVFENVDFTFLPAQWLVRVEDVRAEMAMSQPFPDVWLPKDMTMQFGLTLANGTYDIRYGLSFYDYRVGDVKSSIRFDGRQP